MQLDARRLVISSANTSRSSCIVSGPSKGFVCHHALQAQISEFKSDSFVFDDQKTSSLSFAGDVAWTIGLRPFTLRRQSNLTTPRDMLEGEHCTLSSWPNEACTICRCMNNIL